MLRLRVLTIFVAIFSTRPQSVSHKLHRHPHKLDRCFETLAIITSRYSVSIKTDPAKG